MSEDSSPTLTESFTLLWSEAVSVISGTLRLAAAETRLAVITVIVIFLLMFTGFILIVTAISLFEFAVAMWITGLGFSLTQTVLFLAVVNVLFALGLFWLCYRYSRFLKFERTLNSISSRKVTQRDPQPTE